MCVCVCVCVCVRARVSVSSRFEQSETWRLVKHLKHSTSAPHWSILPWYQTRYYPDTREEQLTPLSKTISQPGLYYRPSYQDRKIMSAATWQNQQNVCAQRRLRSVWASAQSDQSLCCALNGSLKTQDFFMRTAKTLIRLGGCPGWSESSLGAQSLCWFCRVAAQCPWHFIILVYNIGTCIEVNVRSDVIR